MKIDGVRGQLAVLGLGKPIARAILAGVVAGAVLYTLGYPKPCFTDEGVLRPWKPVSSDPKATQVHFLFAPVAVAVAVGLVT